MKPLDPEAVKKLNTEIVKVARKHHWKYESTGNGSGILFGADWLFYKLLFGEYDDKCTVTSFLPPARRDRSLEHDIMAIYV